MQNREANVSDTRVIAARVNARDRAILAAAAAVEHVTLSEFIARAVLKAAEKRLADELTLLEAVSPDAP